MPEPFTDAELDTEIEHADKLAMIAQTRGEAVAATASAGMKRALIAERDERAASKARAEAREKEQEAADAERDAKNAEAAAKADEAGSGDAATAATLQTDHPTMLDTDDGKGRVEDPADFALASESTPSTGDASAAVQPPVPDGAVIGA